MMATKGGPDMTGSLPYPGQQPGPGGGYGGGYAGNYGGPRRGRSALRWAYIGIGAAILLLGVVLIVVSLDPGAFGLPYRSIFPFGGGLFGAFLILWGSLLLVRAAMRAGRRGYGPGPGRRFDPAIVEARRRYARGEITREQFQQIVQDLRTRPPPLP